jgi:hypothetical protein
VYIQEPDPTGSAGFKILGNNIVFSSAPANGHAFFGVILSGADYVTVGTEFPAGSATAPSITFGTDSNTGLYSVTGGTWVSLQMEFKLSLLIVVVLTSLIIKL